ncbi:hypothetical protein [Chitinophaga varians]|uniref:hypothetical protein n=1 Tax=Chitinophaga varians TaxID=2202339 RepID=UPI00166003BF|nr:hypothetical protein [Chitinophaga varians]MBC9910102.1 hypothetical protein [Chitinophaga varians]
MQKIKIAFAALSAVAGFGGAYASTCQGSGNRNATLFNWYKYEAPFNRVYTAKSIEDAKVASGCTALVGVNCLYGTATDSGGVTTYTLHKP